MQDANLGIADEIRERRERILRCSPPAARRRILGQCFISRPEVTVTSPDDESKGVIDMPPPDQSEGKPEPLVSSPFDPVPLPPSGGGEITARIVIRCVCATFHLGEGEFLSPRRPQRITRGRMAAYLLMSKYTKLSTPQMGRAMGRRDHTTVMHGIKRGAQLYNEDAGWRELFKKAEVMVMSCDDPARPA